MDDFWGIFWIVLQEAKMTAGGETVNMWRLHS